MDVLLGTGLGLLGVALFVGGFVAGFVVACYGVSLFLKNRASITWDKETGQLVWMDTGEPVAKGEH